MTRLCGIEGCENKHRGRGLCNKHLQRLVNTGTTDGKDKTPDGSCRAFVEKAAASRGVNDCIVWPYGICTYHGYGKCNYGGRNMNAHRRVLIAFSGGVDPGPEMVARHKCQNRKCVNPEHLEWGTHLDNLGYDRRRDSTNPAGERNPSHKLTESEVLEIRSSGMSASILASRYQVTRGTIYKVLSHQSWKHV